MHQPCIPFTYWITNFPLFVSFKSWQILSFTLMMVHVSVPYVSTGCIKFYRALYWTTIHILLIFILIFFLPVWTFISVAYIFSEFRYWISFVVHYCHYWTQISKMIYFFRRRIQISSQFCSLSVIINLVSFTFITKPQSNLIPRKYSCWIVS